MLFFRVIWAIACLSFLYSIPFKAHAEIIFDARVNNKDVKLLLDTGSELTLLFNKTASRLKLNVIKRNTSSSVDPGKVRVDLTEECVFQLGSTQTKGRLHVYTPPDWFDAGVDGVLAWSTIRDNIFYFSMEGKRSEVLGELPENIESWSRWNIGPDKQLTIQVEKSNGKQGSIFIDTGIPYGIQLNPKRWRDWRNLHSSSPTTLTAFFKPASGLVVREECWANRIDIERFSVKDVPIMQSSPDLVTNRDIITVRNLLVLINSKGFYAEVEYGVFRNWQEVGEDDYRGTTGRTDLQAWIRGRRQDFETVLARCQGQEFERREQEAALVARQARQNYGLARGGYLRSGTAPDEWTGRARLVNYSGQEGL
jgi:hypothetical protein